jgi:hypothetical protein
MLASHGRFPPAVWPLLVLLPVLYGRQLQLLALELEDGLGPLQLAA